jgi:hypothetical protein
MQLFFWVTLDLVDKMAYCRSFIEYRRVQVPIYKNLEA